MTSKLQFKTPVGYFHFHDDIGLNFQFNRALINQCPLEEMMVAAQNIRKYTDVVIVCSEFAGHAERFYNKEQERACCSNGQAIFYRRL